jgi:hypothetical protein
MKLCKAELPNGKPCPNNVDEEQEYCPYHLASQDAETKEKLSIITVVGTGLIIVGTGIYKFVVSKKL